MKVRLPDGRIANFPDTMSPDEVKAILRKKFPPKGTQTATAKVSAETPSVDQGADMLTGLKSGAMRMVTGVGGMIGDAQQVMGNVASWGAEKLGASPETQRLAGDIAGRIAIPGLASRLPTSTQLQGAAETVTGPMARPETFLGQTIEKIGEFAPGAVAGPGGWARRAALAAVPAVAAETAGRIPGIEGSGAQPYVEMGAALTAGLPIAAKSGAGNVMKNMRENAPSHDDVKAIKNLAYGDLDKAGIRYDSNAYRGTAMRIKSALHNNGYDPLSDHQVKALVVRIDDMLKPKKVESWTKVDGILKDAKSILRSNADDTTKRHVGLIVNNLESLVKNAPIKSRGNLTRAQINDRIDEARDFARRDILAKDIKEMQRKFPSYRSGIDSAGGNQFGAYYRRKGKSLSDTERASFEKVINREGPLNAAHMMGSRWGQIAGGSTGSLIGGALGSVMGPIGMGLGAAAGVPVSFATTNAFRKFMDKFTEKAVDDALKTVLAGRAAQKIATSSAEKERIRAEIRKALLAAQAAPEPANSAPGQPAIMAP